MMNYLEVLTQEIDSAGTNQLYLEEIYSSLVSNTYPNAVDEKTQEYLTNLLDAIESYKMIQTKRQRLDYVFQQETAKKIKECIPNPEELLSKAMSFELGGLVRMVVSSASVYFDEMREVREDLIKDGWELDDEAEAVFHSLRKQAFTYMLDIVRDYDIPGDYSLSEDSVIEYVDYRKTTNVRRRILFLESNRSTYENYAYYWLALAEDYYLTGAYQKCLDSVDQYEQIAARIFRKDYSCARILPMAISAARNIKAAVDYVNLAQRYADQILANTDNDEWGLRFFAAETFLDLYLTTGRNVYLEKTFNIILNNVNELVASQKQMNDLFLLGDDQFTDNLPPVYEPLVLNLDFLFEIAKEKNITQEEWNQIDGILHENGQDLFLVRPVDSLYRITNSMFDENSSEDSILRISINDKRVQVPIRYVTEDTVIKVGVGSDGDWVFYSDWKLWDVKLAGKGEHDISYAVYDGGKRWKECRLSSTDDIWVGIQTKKGSKCTPVEAAFDIEISSGFFSNVVKFHSKSPESIQDLPPGAWIGLVSAEQLLTLTAPTLAPLMRPEDVGVISDSQSIAAEDTDGIKDKEFTKTGSIVRFGRYRQQAGDDPPLEDIEWIVLDYEQGKSLLLSRYALDRKAYNDIWGNEKSAWSTSTLFAWLNNDFLNAAFTESEQKVIRMTEFGDSGYYCTGKVFLLSAEEVIRYFPEEKERVCIPTKYTTMSWTGGCHWWLRKEEFSRMGDVINPSGKLLMISGNYNEACVRPAMWVSIANSAA